MPRDHKYISDVGYLGNVRYYLEIRPVTATGSDNVGVPANWNETAISLLAFRNVELHENKNDDDFGIQRPTSLSFTVDLQRLPDDLQTYITKPFYLYENFEKAFTFRQPTELDLPAVRTSTIVSIYTDEGDDTLTKSNFKLYKSFGFKNNPGRSHTIIDAGTIRKHYVEIVLYDVTRIILESIHPIYMYWMAIDDVVNNTRFTPKTVEHVWDTVYKGEGAASDYYAVRTRIATKPTSSDTTIDGVTMAENDLVMHYNVDTQNLAIYRYDGSDYELVRDFKTQTIKLGELFKVAEGTSYGGDHYLLIDGRDITGGNKLYLTFFFVLIDQPNETTLMRLYGKLDGNFFDGSLKAHYLPLKCLNNYMTFLGSFIYSILMRDLGAWNLEFDGHFLKSYTLHKQNYERNSGKGAEITALEDNIYICALVENAGHWVDGLFYENSNSDGIFEFDNVYDLFELTKGHCLQVNYYNDGNTIKLVYNSRTGQVTSGTGLTLESSDMKGLINQGEIHIKEDDKLARGAIINVNVSDDNISEHKFINAGTINEDEMSFKCLFTTNPTVNLDADGFIVTKNYPELKSSLSKLIYKQNNPERAFDIRKVYYTDTPSDIADSELLILPHNAALVDISSSPSGSVVSKLNNWPIGTQTIDQLKFAILSLQKKSGIPYYTAKRLAKHYNVNGRPILELLVPSDIAIKTPIGHRINLSLSNYLFDDIGPNAISIFIVTRKEFSIDEQYTLIEIEGR